MIKGQIMRRLLTVPCKRSLKSRTVPSCVYIFFASDCLQILHFKCTSVKICLATFSRADHSWVVSLAFFFLDENRAAYKTTRQISVWLCVGDSVVYSVRKKRTWISFPWEGHALRLSKLQSVRYPAFSFLFFFHGPFLETTSLPCIFVPLSYDKKLGSIYLPGFLHIYGLSILTSCCDNHCICWGTT